jgi:hypothetical protein
VHAVDCEVVRHCNRAEERRLRLPVALSNREWRSAEPTPGESCPAKSTGLNHFFEVGWSERTRWAVPILAPAPTSNESTLFVYSDAVYT